MTYTIALFDDDRRQTLPKKLSRKEALQAFEAIDAEYLEANDWNTASVYVMKQDGTCIKHKVIS